MSGARCTPRRNARWTVTVASGQRHRPARAYDPAMNAAPDAVSGDASTLARQFRELRDRVDIAELLDRYAAAIDAKDWGALDGVFTPDAHLDYTSPGGPAGPYPEVRAWLATVLAPVPLLQHYVSGAIVTLDPGDPDRARSICNLFNPMGSPAEGGVFIRLVGGRYHDRLARTPDGWRITDRRMERRWSADLGTATALPADA